MGLQPPVPPAHPCHLWEQARNHTRGLCVAPSLFPCQPKSNSCCALPHFYTAEAEISSQYSTYVFFYGSITLCTFTYLSLGSYSGKATTEGALLGSCFWWGWQVVPAQLCCEQLTACRHCCWGRRKSWKYFP